MCTASLSRTLLPGAEADSAEVFVRVLCFDNCRKSVCRITLWPGSCLVFHLWLAKLQQSFQDLSTGIEDATNVLSLACWSVWTSEHAEMFCLRTQSEY